MNKTNLLTKLLLLCLCVVGSANGVWADTFNVEGPTSNSYSKDGVTIAGTKANLNFTSSGKKDCFTLNSASSVWIYSLRTNITGVSFDIVRNTNGNTKSGAVTMTVATGGAYSTPSSGFTATNDGISIVSLQGITAIGNNQTSATAISVSFSSAVKTIVLTQTSSCSVRNITVTYDNSIASPSTYFAAHISDTNTATIDTNPGGASTTVATSGSSTVGEETWYKLNSAGVTIDLGEGHAFEVGDQIAIDIAGGGTNKTNKGTNICKSDGTSIAELKTGALTNAVGFKHFYIVKADDGIEGQQSMKITSGATDCRYYSYSVLRTAPVAPSTPEFDPVAGSIGTGEEISISSTGATSLKWKWGASAEASKEDAAWSSAEVYSDSNKPVAGEEGADNNVLSVLAINDYGKTLGSASYTFLTASDLAVADGKGTITIATDGSYTLTKGTDYTTSSTGAITYENSTPATATISALGVITPVAVGSTTITLKQAADATYAAKDIEFTVNVVAAHSLNANAVTPSTTLDLSNASAASTSLNKTWKPDSPYYGNDGDNNYVVFSVYSSVNSKNNGVLDWVGFNNQDGKTYGGTSDINTGSETDPTQNNWEAPSGSVFKGGFGYHQEKKTSSEKDYWGARFSTTNNSRNYTVYSYRIKGVSKVQSIIKSNGGSYTVTMAAYEITSGTAASTTLLYAADKSNTVKKLEVELDPAKEYLVTLENDASTNSRLYEMAFFYDEDVNVTKKEVVGTADGKSYATYVTKNRLDFGNTDGITAYIATGTNGAGTAVLLQSVNVVEAETPILVKTASAGQTYSVSVTTTTATDATENKLKKGPATFTASNETAYILSSGMFYLADAGFINARKAYLDISGSARALSIEFDDENETTGIVNVRDNKENVRGDFYDLSGRKVSLPTKGLYIMNGKKMIIK